MAKVTIDFEQLARDAVDAELKRRDLVSVVRCRDCKHAREVDEWEWWCSGFGFPARLVTADGYCYKGEKKE